MRGCGRGWDKAQPPLLQPSPSGHQGLAHRDHHDATPLTPKPFLSFDQELSFLRGFFWGREPCTHQEHQPQSRGAAGTVFQGLGPAWGRCSFFSLGHVAGGGRGVFAMRVGSGQRAGAGEEARGCSWTCPPSRNMLGDPRVARRHPDRPRGQQSVGVGGAPYPGDPPLSSISGSCLRPLLSQGLRQLPRHRPLDVCTFLLVNVSRNQKLRDAALCPRCLLFCSPRLEISTHTGWARTHTHTHPSIPTAQESSKKLPELPGQMAGTSPRHAQGNRAPCGSGAMPPSAARLARCPPARCQAKFLAISRLTPAARDAPASSCLQPRTRAGSIPGNPHPASPCCPAQPHP